MVEQSSAPPIRVREALSGTRILITGASGFLGTALVAKILGSIPEVAELLLLVRSKPGAPAEARVERRILGSSALKDLRERDDWDALAAKVRTLDGDLSRDGLGLSAEDLDALAEVDVVVHAAATVSFDAPVDEAFETNLIGPQRLLDALAEAGAAPKRIVHVSTAYVAGVVKGHVPEAPWTDTPGRPRLDWRAELDVAREVRTQVELESRTPELARELTADARRETGPAGAPAVAARAEQVRKDWVSDRLVGFGRDRARSLGWPDAYSFTKALAETAVRERAEADDLPLVILRPSIIEGALAEPAPGWIRGFRMADPIIMAYGRGALSEFPGIPDAVVDVVPVDLVVNAILVTAAAPDPPDVLHATTGCRNPMLYRDLVRHTHDYFHDHPYTDEDGQPILPEMWTFPGRRSVMTRLKWGRRALERAQRVLDHLPTGRFGAWQERVDSELDDLEQAEKYAELYGAYAESEAVFDDARAASLHEALEDEESEIFGFDPKRIDWRAYLHEAHLPEVTRRRGTVRRRKRPAPGSTVEGEGPDVLAVFDLEGTVLGTNVVDTYLWLRLAASPRSEWARRVGHLAAEVPSLLATERRDRGEFLRAFYRRYDDAPVDEVQELAREAFDRFVLPRSFPAAIRRIREHRAAGHRVVVITGALDFTVSPLAPLCDVMACARLRSVDGRYTGELLDVPLAGEARGTYLRRVAEELGADLRASYAYADSLSDLPMLEAVGNPVAVNPDARLARVARKRRWAVERWSTEPGAPRFPVPDPDGFRGNLARRLADVVGSGRPR